MIHNLKTQIVSLNRRNSISFPKSFFSKPNRIHCYAIIYREDDSGSYENEDDDKEQFNQKKDRIKINQEQTINSLNKMFYYNYTLSYQELKDLIIGTFKKLYRIKLEIYEGKICFVVYPEVKSEDDIEYKREMDAIAMILTDYMMKEYLYDELKKITVFQRGIIIIPLHIDVQ
uniref:Uncharacterized protein n=1 Tax=viral metagenome TaxID=1070528 RepID=A0A6C0CSE0_9ZZZZ